MQNFNVETVSLDGVNLVEASAGTGKTYSVAILVLRLLLEKNIPIDRILMVTFTNAAVAEMAHRIRKFIRFGIQAAGGAAISEPLIQRYIQGILEGTDSQQLVQKLNGALVGLDEASIQTIHSFCQDSLQLFAFETGQAYGLTLQEDLSDPISLFVEEFWRDRITGLPVEFLASMKELGISMKTLKKAANESLGGKIFQNQIQGNDDYVQECQRLKETVDSYLQANKARIKEEVRSVRIPRFSDEKRIELINVLDKGVEEVWKWINDKYQYHQTLRENIFRDFKALYETFQAQKLLSLKNLIYECACFVEQGIKEYLEKNHLLTYDDMITKLHRSVQHGEELRSKLSARFDAIFIDEFQDTDKLQYEIYDQVFGQDKILFYIGDPKQSIYGWRKADLNTYFQAVNKPGVNGYTMDSNFRSTPALLDAMNDFFSIPDPFLSPKIKYIPVESGISGQRHGISQNGVIIEPIQVFKAPAKKDIPDKVCDLVAGLLSDDIRVNGEVLKLSDIAILVRTKYEGKEIKRLLAKIGIPAVNVDETKIFETPEAENLQFILETILDISWKGVNKALLNQFTGWKSEDILAKDSDQLVSLFKEYQTLWAEKGVFTMLRRYVLDFGVMDHLLYSGQAFGKRIFTNLNQLMEILQEAEYKQELKPSGLLSFLQKQRNQESTDGDSYIQRLEDDQESITLMTIHKSKGLEFPVVIAPYLNLDDSEKFDYSTYRDSKGEYRFYHNQLEEDQTAKKLFKEQVAQENRRLLYVAVTRAVYNCFIFQKDTNKIDSLNPFVQGVEGKIKLYGFAEFPYPEINLRLNLNQNAGQLRAASLPSLALPDHNWRKLSFSYLTLKTKPFPKLNEGVMGNPYDEFIFKKLPRGASIGDLLHYIFERIDFQEETSWTEIVAKAISRHFPQFGEDMAEHLLELVNQVVSTQIPQVAAEFSLSQLEKGKKINEWEFDLKSGAFEPAALMSIPIEEDFMIRSVEGKSLQGILNGLVDMVFEFQGKYFILDWKSNFLGDSLEDYNYEGLLEAMNSNNYHLQYLLYTLALKLYLEKYQQNFDFDRDFGGVIYLFLRGMRVGQTTGIFSYTPKMHHIAYLESLIQDKVLV